MRVSSFTLYVVQFISYILAKPNALQEFKAGNIIFTANLYKKIVLVESSSFMVSPLSAELALALLESGSADQTKTEIRTALQLPSTEAQIEDAMKALILSLTKSEKYTFNIANKIYVRENFSINPTYQKIAIDVYQAGVENIDFSQEDQAANTINKWVANQTNNKIQNLVSPQSIKSAFSVLINTIYMNGNWSIQFMKEETNDNLFHLSLKQTTQVKTMHQSNKLHKYKEDSNLKAKFLQMDLLDNNASVTFVLPNSIDGLSALEDQINKVLNTYDLDWARVNIALPTFETKTALDLSGILQKLGIKTAFNPENVNLSKIGGQKGDIVVSKVFQKTYLKIIEGGIEAAAATAIIGVKITTVGQPVPTPKLFIANHPFIYIVRVDAVVVFIGRYTGPT